MKNRDSKAFHRIGIVVSTALALWPGLAGAAERTLTFDGAHTEVAFDLPATGHDVHGLISFRQGEIRFDDETGRASGEIVLDAASAVSGNDSRDKTLREEVFEAAKFPEIRFIADRVEGRLAAEGTSEIRLAGRVRLHGVEHPLTMKAKVVAHGTHLSADTEFPVPFLDWGLEDPSILFLRVEPVVTVKIHAEGELAASPVASPVASAAGGGGE
jgi:polyisoprenoid-binding protein YceI